LNRQGGCLCSFLMVTSSRRFFTPPRGSIDLDHSFRGFCPCCLVSLLWAWGETEHHGATAWQFKGRSPDGSHKVQSLGQQVPPRTYFLLPGPTWECFRTSQ
jgi:hypothetical protein